MYQKPMLKEGSLNEQVIVVTGGGSGLRKAMTMCFFRTWSFSCNNVQKY